MESEVSRLSFLRETEKLITESVAGDKLGITQSGHGTKKYSYAEEVFYDEAIYFNDGLVVDDDMRKILDKLPDGVELFIFFDTCHSGGMMRLAGDKIRYVEPDLVLPRARKRKSVIEEPGKEIFVSGCLSDEYSYDASALKNGAATYYALHTYRDGYTCQKWYDKIREYLPSEAYPQTPYLSATQDNKNKIVFKAER